VVLDMDTLCRMSSRWQAERMRLLILQFVEGSELCDASENVTEADIEAGKSLVIDPNLMPDSLDDIAAWWVKLFSWAIRGRERQLLQALRERDDALNLVSIQSEVEKALHKQAIELEANLAAANRRAERKRTMMDPNHHLTQTCWLCGHKESGRFRSSSFYCGRHLHDEIEHHQSMSATPSKDDKALSRLYAKRWQPAKPVELYTKVNHWKPKANAVPVSKNRKPRGER